MSASAQGYYYGVILAQMSFKSSSWLICGNCYVCYFLLLSVALSIMAYRERWTTEEKHQPTNTFFVPENESSSRKLLADLLGYPGFVTYYPEGAEVKENRIAQFHVNVEAVWNAQDFRRRINEELHTLVRESFPNTDIFVGVETGGSPFANYLADRMHTAVILARKEGYQFAGHYDNWENSEATIVEDVLGTGGSAEPHIALLKELKVRKVNFATVFSYGEDAMISAKYGINIASLFTIDHVLELLEQEPKFLDRIKEPVAQVRRRFHSIVTETS